MDELLSILSLRPEYFGEEKEAGPFVYNNGDYVGTLELQSAESVSYTHLDVYKRQARPFWPAGSMSLAGKFC